MKESSLAGIRGWKHFASLVILGMCILFFDFLSKGYVYHVLTFGNPCQGGLCLNKSIFSNFLGIDFSIDPAMNTGMAWGLFPNLQNYLLIVRIVIVAGLFVYLLFFNRDHSKDMPLVMIASGAIGNIIDFFLYGYVIDFLHFNLWGYHFPIFNLADTFITSGVILLLVMPLFKNSSKAFLSR